MQLYLFGSITADLIMYFIEKMLETFTQEDIDILIFVLHNIGLQLRKQETVQLKKILDLVELKRNQFAALVKLEEADPNTIQDILKLK